MKKLFSTIIALAMAAGFATNTVADNLSDADILSFYSGNKVATQDDSHKTGFLPESSNSDTWVVIQPAFLPESTLRFSSQLSAGDTRKNSPLPTFNPGNANDSHYGIKASGEYNFGDYYAVTGLSYDRKILDGDGITNEQHLKSLGISMGAGKKINDLTTGLMYVYMTGDESAGNNFQPFYIFTAANAANKNSETSLDEVHALSLYADYDLNKQFNISGSLGFAKIKKTTEADATSKEENIRLAVELGASYKLLDNLIFEAHFGYLDNGELFEKIAADESQTSMMDSPAYQLSNQLTLTF